MNDLYPWLDEYLDCFPHTYCTTVDGKTERFTGRYSEIDSPKFKNYIRKDYLDRLLQTLKITFGDYWNPSCETRLKYIQRKPNNTDYRRPYAFIDNEIFERFLELTDQLDFIFLYTKYCLVRDQLSLEHSRITPVMNLFQAIAVTKPTEEALNPYVTNGIREHFAKCAEEYRTTIDLEAAADADPADLFHRLADKYTELIQKIEKKNRAPLESEEIQKFNIEANKASEVIRKRYECLEEKEECTRALDIAVYDRAFRAGLIKPVKENTEKKRGRKKELPADIDPEIMENHYRNSPLNRMSDQEFYFLVRLGHPQIEKMLSHPTHSWETVPADVRAVTAKALEDFSEDDAFYAYINIDRSKNAETVNELTSPIRNPLYPIQRELGTALCYLLDIAANDEVLSSRCITRVLNKFERQLQDVLECFGTSEQALYPWSIPESGADGKALWFDTLLEDSPSDTGEPKDVRPRVLNHMAQLLQMIFGRYLRPECMLRLIESVRKDPGTGYMQSEEYKLYDSYCQLIQHCRGLLILFFKEYLKKGYVIKKSYNKISSLFYRVKDYISNFESPDSQTIEQFNRFSEEAKAIYSAEQLTYACKKFNNDTLFLKSWTKQIMDQQTYSKMFGLKQKLEMTYPFVILQCAEEDMHRVYDLLWLRIFRLDDAAEKNQSHLNYEKEKKIYDEDVRERQNKLRGDYSTKRPPAIKAPDSTVMARDYRYQIPDAEFEFLTCIFKIAFTKPKRRLPLTANLLSENDRKDILEALQKLRNNVNIHFYINVKQNCKADITACKKDIKKDSVDLEPDIIIDICQIAEYKLLYPQANQIYDIVCRICNHFTQDGLFSKNADKELLLRTYPLITEAVKYIHEKMNLPSAAAQPEAKENTTDRMKNALDEWCAGLSKKEKMMYLPADPIDHGDCQ